MSKEKTGMEMIFDMLKPYMDEAEKVYKKEKEENEDGSDNEDETENEDHKYYNKDCESCIYWDDDECCCAFDNETKEEEEKHYCYPECKHVDGECVRCEYWNYEDYCKLDDREEDYEEEDEDAFDDCNDCDYDCNQWSTKEDPQTDNLSKFIMSVNTVLGGDMGLLVFDKSNKKDMEKLAAIFREYAKRLS